MVKTKRTKSSKSTKKSALSKAEKRQVVTIAKRVMTKDAEHKYIVKGVNELGVLANSIYCINPMANITLGTDAHSRVGEAIGNVRLRGKIVYQHTGIVPSLPSFRNWQSSKLRVMVIKTRRQLTGSTVTWTDQTTALGDTSSASGRDSSLFYQPDGWSYPFHVGMQDVRSDNDFTVLFDKVVTSSTQVTTQTVSGSTDYGNYVTCKFSVRVGKFEFGEASTSYARKDCDNVYILVAPYMPRAISGTDQAGWVGAHYSVSWTDD